MESTSNSHLQPLCMQTDEYAGADAARQRLVRKSRFPFFKSTPNLRAATSKHSKGGHWKGKGKSDDNEDQEENTPTVLVSDTRPQSVNFTSLEERVELSNKIILDDSVIPDGLEDKDVYRWAILYENQRGYVVVFF
jgi:hypothetical protein